YASWFAYRAFADDGAYAAWRAGTERLPLTAVVDAGVRAFLRRLHRESPAVAADAWQWSPPWSRGGLEDFDGASVLRDENLPSLAEALLSQPLPADAAQRARAVSRREELWRWITLSEPDDAFARRVVLGAIDRDDALSGAAIKTLASLDRDWAFDALVERLRTPLVRSHAMAFGVALGNRGDPRAIPHMIAAIAANDVRGVRDGLGWFGLNMLSGRSGGRARWNTAPDAAWWLAWWDEHRMRYGARVRAIDPRALR
ncbi:MAG: hypothetical protein OER88_14030, partial [Planctomycetota bacterium]|nr:hypothetical protein [Planctomycetota bacterium]